MKCKTVSSRYFTSSWAISVSSERTVSVFGLGSESVKESLNFKIGTINI